MQEDTALTLKKTYEKGETVPPDKVQALLTQSELLERLLVAPKKKPRTFAAVRAYEWRLIELSEIPFTHTLEKVQAWLEMLVEKTYIEAGFSLRGTRDGLLACHNAMLTTLLMKMAYADRAKIDAGIEWIVRYQSVERGIECPWTGKDLFTKYGGCMKKIPCFYGVVKSMVALTEYKKRYGSTEKIDDKLSQGLEYILKHKVFKRLSVDEPIEPSIVKNFYPYTYKTNLIETLSLLKANGLLEDERCQEARALLKQSQRSDGFWQADVSYMKSAWVDFDKPRQPGPWITYVIQELVA